MKAVCHLRIADGSRGLVFGVTAKPSTSPLRSGSEDLPTICVKLVLDLPPGVFDPAIAVLEAKIPKEDVKIAMEVSQ